MGQKGGRKAAEGGTVVARANQRLDEAQGYGLGVARDHLQTRPRGQGQRRRPVQTPAEQGKAPEKTCREIHPDTQPSRN